MHTLHIFACDVAQGHHVLAIEDEMVAGEDCTMRIEADQVVDFQIIFSQVCVCVCVCVRRCMHVCIHVYAYVHTRKNIHAHLVQEVA